MNKKENANEMNDSELENVTGGIGETKNTDQTDNTKDVEIEPRTPNLNMTGVLVVF